MVVTGTPDKRRASRSPDYDRPSSQTADAGAERLASTGCRAKGTSSFDLDIAATNFPVADIASFLDFADIPVTGDLTGTLKIAGRRNRWKARAASRSRNGAILGEPVELASADIAFTQGRMQATNVLGARARPARSAARRSRPRQRALQLHDRVELDRSLEDQAAGARAICSAATSSSSRPAPARSTQPELVRRGDARRRHAARPHLPAGSPPPSLYLAIRNGRLIVRGAIADIVTIEGEGAVGENMRLDGRCA